MQGAWVLVRERRNVQRGLRSCGNAGGVGLCQPRQHGTWVRVWVLVLVRVRVRAQVWHRAGQSLRTVLVAVLACG